MQDTFGKRRIETENTKMVLISTHHGRLPRSPKGKLAMTSIKWDFNGRRAFAMTGVNLQQTFKYKYTLKQICHCEEQRDDAISYHSRRLLRYARNDRTVGERKKRNGYRIKSGMTKGEIKKGSGEPFWKQFNLLWLGG